MVAGWLPKPAGETPARSAGRPALRGAHVAWVPQPVPPAMEADPGDIGLFRPKAVVQVARTLPHLVEQAVGWPALGDAFIPQSCRDDAVPLLASFAILSRLGSQ